MLWNDRFESLFDQCLERYHTGDKDFANYYTASDLEFLASIGCKPREFFDFIEDNGEEGEPSRATALLIAAVRRDYFIVMQNSVPFAGPLVTHDDLPTFGDTLAGMTYLPRLIIKARAKLMGALDPDVMFGCGGDRKFLRDHGNIHPADFLRHVWASHDDDQKIAAWVLAQSA